MNMNREYDKGQNPKRPAKMTPAAIETLIEAARTAGKDAAYACIPTPMHIHGYAPIEGGPCGFAWINVKPGTGQVAKALVVKGLARKDGYLGGVTIWVDDYGQSMTRKAAFARAFATHLQAAGIRAYADSRMD